jgi:hypothetical protein
MAALYAATIFLSAALLFSVQPLFAKMILPQLGGTPAVWNTCMLFFQVLLLAGYAYAHVSTRWLTPRRQPLLHLALLLLAVIVLPIAVPSTWTPPRETTPVFWLLGLLTVAVGAPFFCLSATAPLLQCWFGYTRHASASDPYFLYAASNLGSMLALLSYPVLVEPTLRLAQQSWFWAWGYGVLVLAIAGCALALWRPSPACAPAEKLSEPAAEPTRRRSRKKQRDAELPRVVDWPRRLNWIGLSFVPSSWMLAVTTHLTTDVAAVPLLWVIPLALYLLTFILVFSRTQWIPHDWLVRLFPFAVILLCVSVILQPGWQILLLHLCVFFIGSLVCHRELARDRPAVDHLTEYFFWMSLGGALGGVFNALVAPLVFPWLLEYPLTVLLACWLRPSLYPQDDSQSRWIDVAFLAGFVALLGVLLYAATALGIEIVGSDQLRLVVLFGLPLLAIFYFIDQPGWFAATVGMVLIASKFLPPFNAEVLHTARSFFGVHRVLFEAPASHVLLHGTTIHGIQSTDPGRACQPLSYYHRGGPLGDVFHTLASGQRSQPVAVIGLGAGAAVCYCEPNQSFTFYEIDPIVERLARSPQYFSYLSDCCRGTYEVVLGDGRLRLSDAPDGQYGLILLDAFSSDSIPVHLLTREAIALYLSKLADGGRLAFHISNAHLDLQPVLRNLAVDAGLHCAFGEDRATAPANTGLQQELPSNYAVLTREAADLQALLELPNWKAAPSGPAGDPWTDEFSNIVSILKWREAD